MTLENLRVHVVPGDGTVARVNETVLVAFPETPEHANVVGRVLDLVAKPSDGGRDLVRSLVRLLIDTDTEDTPTFAILASDENDAVVFACGAIDVGLTSNATEQVVSGRDSATWIDRVIPGPLERVWIGDGYSAGARQTDLRAGVVLGGGVELDAVEGTISAVAARPAPDTVAEVIEEPEPTAAVPVGQPEPDAVQPVLISLTSTIDPEPPRAPLPVVETLAEPANEHMPGAALVQGIRCSRGHFNDPNALFCGVCGINMVNLTHNLVEGERPPLGVLVRDDGATFVLDGDYVIGRNPDSDPEVVAGAAKPLEVDDPKREISRIHARVHLHNWMVVIMDGPSANGTYLSRPNAKDWDRVPPGSEVALVPGSRVRVGQRTFVFETNRRTA